MEIQTTSSFLSYLKRIRERTRRIVLCIPPEDLEWTYAAGKFTIGDLVRHIAASERYMFAENVAGRQSCYPGHGRELASGFEGVVDYLDQTHEESLEIFGGLSDEALKQECSTPGAARIATWKWLRAMIEHEIHHRGQIFTYLAMRGHPVPALYGLTEEEVRARSIESKTLKYPDPDPDTDGS